MKILLATDGSECSQAAAQEIAARVWPEGTTIRVVSAVEVPISIAPETWILPEGYYGEIEAAARKQAQAAADSATAVIKGAQDDKVVVETELLSGIPKHAVVDEAERWGADLVVVGSHGYSGFERFLLGSVSQSIAHHARCSVLIVRCRPAKPAS